MAGLNKYNGDHCISKICVVDNSYEAAKPVRPASRPAGRPPMTRREGSGLRAQGSIGKARDARGERPRNRRRARQGKAKAKELVVDPPTPTPTPTTLPARHPTAALTPIIVDRHLSISLFFMPQLYELIHQLTPSHAHTYLYTS